MTEMYGKVLIRTASALRATGDAVSKTSPFMAMVQSRRLVDCKEAAFILEKQSSSPKSTYVSLLAQEALSG